MPRLLVDTHVVLWYASDSPRLTNAMRAILSAPESVLHISIVSWWEIAVKHSMGKLPLHTPLHTLMDDMVYRGFQPLPITPTHINQAHQLPFPNNGHRDPFNRLLIAQAITENLTMLSSDTKFDDYPIRREF